MSQPSDERPTPSPGSAEAETLGCSCPTFINGSLAFGDDFLVAPDCVVHSTAEPRDAVSSPTDQMLAYRGDPRKMC